VFPWWRYSCGFTSVRGIFGALKSVYFARICDLLRESRADHQALELVSNCLKLRICGVLLGFLNGARCRDRICDPFRVKEHTRVAFQGFSAYGAVMGHFPGRVAACLSVGWYHVIEHATVDAAWVLLSLTNSAAFFTLRDQSQLR
jgi:hypothetical protein